MKRLGVIDFAITDVPEGPREDEAWICTITRKFDTPCSLYSALIMPPPAIADKVTHIDREVFTGAINHWFCGCGKTKRKARAEASRLALEALGAA